MNYHHPEHDTTDVSAVEREQAAVLATYAIWVTTATNRVYFYDDLRSAVHYANHRDRYDDGIEITDEDRRAFAASTILARIAECSSEQRSVVVSPLVHKCIDVYNDAQTAIDAVGLSFGSGVMQEETTIITTAQRLNGKDVPTTAAIETAVSVMSSRGSISMEMESVDDIVTASEAVDEEDTAPDAYFESEITGATARVEVRNLSNLHVPSTLTELPFYQQFYEVEHGTKWLTSLLEDLQTIRDRWSE